MRKPTSACQISAQITQHHFSDAQQTNFRAALRNVTEETESKRVNRGFLAVFIILHLLFKVRPGHRKNKAWRFLKVFSGM